MRLFKAMTGEEWLVVKEKGFLHFYLDNYVTTAALGIVIFSITDFVVNYTQQTDLMKAGVMFSLVFPLLGGVLMWYLLRRRFVRLNGV